jgi:molecular chaperone GrpE
MRKKQPEKNEAIGNSVQTEEEEISQEAGTETAAVEEPASQASMDGDILALEDELQAARARANEYLNGWQRSQADFANYKKRVARDQEQVYQNAAASVIKRYLDILDDLERALKNRPDSGEGAAWSAGIELVYRKFLAILEAEGLKPMEAEGEPFDPNFHEAIMQEESPEHESGTVIEVLQQGYFIGDRVLRPARVRVAK